jgi:peptide/nickel transport system substrate-binding protein
LQDSIPVSGGPYAVRVVDRIRGEVTLARNDRYWGPKGHWAKVTEKVISKDPTRLAAFLSGQVDAIDAVPIADLDRLRKEGRFGLYRGAAALVHYVALGCPGRLALRHGEGRQATRVEPAQGPAGALSLSVNRDVLGGSASWKAAASPQPAPVRRCSASKSLKPDPFDPAKAQALLKEAGWGEGFRIVLHATADRYPNDAAVAQAIAQMWTRIGLKAEVETLPGSVFFTRASKQEFSAFAAQYGAEEATNSLRALVATFTPAKGFGTANRARYTNPVVDSLLQESMVTMDDELRQAKLERAITSHGGPAPPAGLLPHRDFAAKGLVDPDGAAPVQRLMVLK